jgi:DNA-damage-inducible protein D
VSSQDTTSSPFEAIKHTTEEGAEYWSARELAPILDYSRWQRFWPVIEKAMVACGNSGQTLEDHFTRVGKMIETGKGAKRVVDDWLLSRYACYLVVQNADPEKPIIALGQTYFAVRTREAELAEEAALQGMTEDQLRLYVRRQLADHNKQLAEAAYAAGVPSDGFAAFQNHGYRGLYAGETAATIASRKGLTKGQEILDHMGSTELAANLFRATQAEEKLRRSGPIGQAAANQVHYDMGKAVRQFILDQGGTPPEQLPTPAQSIQQLQRQEQQRLEAERRAKLQPSLFSPDPDADNADSATSNDDNE